MPIATYSQYCKMLESAAAGKYAYPAINVSSLSTANAVIKAFADAKSDGIIQVSTGGGEFASGQGVKNAVVGAITLAEHLHRVASHYHVLIALHTDHCPAAKVSTFLEPLLAESEKRRKHGLPSLFNSHMFDGSDLPLDENLKVARGLIERCTKSEIILEVEAGVVGGEEDGVNHEGAPSEKLYTTPDDMVKVAKTLSPLGKYMLAATFGNVHGVYKPGNVKLKPEILKNGQAEILKKCGASFRAWLVFHGGSGSLLSEIHETLEYGVVKMNIDTDTQYAYTRAVADFMLKNYDQVLKIDGEVGSKKHYDPRAWQKIAEKSLGERVIQACTDLRSKEKSLMATGAA